MNARRRVSVFVNLLIASSLLLMFTAAEGQELKKIKIGYPAIAYNQLAVWVAKDAGLFRRFGLDAELVFFRGGQMGATVKAALKGYVEAVHYIHAHKEGTNRILAQYLRNPDPEVLDASYRAFVKMVPKKPYPTLKGIQLLLDELAAEMPQAKSARPEQFVDLSLLQELEKEGFFAEMGQKYP